jgi:hypothetical protein
VAAAEAPLGALSLCGREWLADMPGHAFWTVVVDIVLAALVAHAGTLLVIDDCPQVEHA